ncbi:MAG: adenylate/guanylate cyclase domain-containing protein, partial [Candidatus Fermentibacteria bacterium]|nr:adenylate/guanylate cyclase domain-containing protein [Candidatus Fermentibacteria bacterium]
MKQIFLFTDIEGSTKLWEKDSEAMSRMLVLHDKFLSEVIPEFGGVIVKHTGDGVFAVFNKSSSVLSCVVKLQKAFTGIGSDRKNFGIKVRMGLHY